MIQFTVQHNGDFWLYSAQFYKNKVSIYEGDAAYGYIWLGDLKRKLFEELLDRGFYKRLSQEEIWKIGNNVLLMNVMKYMSED